MVDDYREMTGLEKRILQKLISGVPTYSEKLSKQINSCLVRGFDSLGSLDLKVLDRSEPIDAKGPIVTGQQEDFDSVEGGGPYINFLLFIHDGFASELQIYKDDGSSIKFQFDPDKFSLIPRL